MPGVPRVELPTRTAMSTWRPIGKLDDVTRSRFGAGCSTPPRSSPDLALDDVVDLKELWLAGELDPKVGQDGHQGLTVGFELLPRVPDFADSQIPVCSKENVVVHAVRRPGSASSSRRRLSSYFSRVTFVGLNRMTTLMEDRPS